MVGLRIKLFSFILIFASMFGVVSCYDKDDYDFNKIAQIEWDPAYAIKILHGNLSLSDFDEELEDFQIRSYPDGLLYFYYESFNESDSIGGIVEFPDVSVNSFFNSRVNFVGNLNQELLIIDDTLFVNLNISGGQIDSSFYRTFNLDILLRSSVDLSYELNFTFPTFIEDGIPISRSYTRLTGEPLIIEEQNEFIDFLADLTTSNPAYNRFPIVIEARLLPANNVVITQADYFEFRFDIYNQGFNWIVGYFEPDSRVISEEDLSIDLFNNNFEGNYGLEGTLMSFELDHDFGVPIRLAFNTLQAGNEDGDILPLIIDPPSPIDINYPTVLGTSARDTLAITNTSEIFNFRPDKFQYQIEAFVNAGIPTGRNFLTDTSTARVKFVAEVPLWGFASGIVMQDTVTIDLQELSADGIEINTKAAVLKTLVTNGYPVDVFIQAVMLDENYNVIDSLLSADQVLIVNAARTSDDGIEQEGVFDGEIVLEEGKVDALFDATYMIIIGRLRTFTNQDGTQPNVKFFNQGSVQVDMGLRTELNVKIKP